MNMSSCGREFLEFTRPILEAGDLDTLSWHLQRRWPGTLLRDLLFHDCLDVAKVSLFSLSLVGTMEDCPAISCLLRHEEAYVYRLAEHALWAIWLRGDVHGADVRLRQAVYLIADNRLEEALHRLNVLVADCPDFAEAYDQRGIVQFLRGAYELARRDLKTALRLNPVHFAAAIGLGHCSAVEGRCDEALAYYHTALQIHPQAEGLHAAIDELEHCRGVQPEPTPVRPLPRQPTTAYD